MAKVEPISIFNTFATCFETRGEEIPATKWEWTQSYLEGKYPPHYPVPVTWPVAVTSTGLWFYLVYRYRKWGKTRLV